MEIARTTTELSAHIDRLKSAGKKIAFVPTMGALHAGHLSLVDLAHKNADAVVSSVFVNPTQFGPKEDFSRYPRQEAADADMLQKSGVDILFLPTVDIIYPGGAASDIRVPEPFSSILCGAFRPGHFDGVATVVARLLKLVQPTHAVFGEKDFQQLMVIRWLVDALKLGVTILPAPILREKDGLAMSSRNAYLTPEERALAPLLFHTLNSVAESCKKDTPIGEALAKEEQHLTEKGFAVDYLEIRAEKNLAPLTKITAEPARIFVAAHLGKTRLIDNISVN
jgi:pantoate--beta-alanine ligase